MALINNKDRMTP